MNRSKKIITCIVLALGVLFVLPQQKVDASCAQNCGGELRIATFNIFFSTGGGRDWRTRLDKSSRVIKSNKFDVVGLQEVRQNQWAALKTSKYIGDEYGIFPKVYKGYGAQNPIAWRTSDVELVSGKLIPGYQIKGHYNAQANVLVKLKLKETGQMFYVINHHEPVGKGISIKARYNSAQKRYAYIKNLSKSGLPIFLTGDWNSKYNNENAQPTFGGRNNSVYCIFTKDALFWDAYDAFKNKSGPCPTKSPDKSLTGLGSLGPVDHIFMSKSVKATKYNGRISNPGNGSDTHHTIYADVRMAGGGENTNPGNPGNPGNPDTGGNSNAAKKKCLAGHFIWDSKNKKCTKKCQDGYQLNKAKKCIKKDDGAPSPTGDTQKPTVEVTAPKAGIATEKITVLIKADAKDNKKVSRVVFFYAPASSKPEYKSIATDKTMPYSHSWDVQALSAGKYQLRAKAYDSSGNSAISKPVTVSIVRNKAPTTPTQNPTTPTTTPTTTTTPPQSPASSSSTQPGATQLSAESQSTSAAKDKGVLPNTGTATILGVLALASGIGAATVYGLFSRKKPRGKHRI